MRPAAMALLLAAGVITLAGTAGCAGGSGAGTGGTSLPQLTSPGATASPSLNPSPSLSVPPPARQHTVKGAEEFVRYYFTLLDHAFVTGDVGPYLAASAKDCESCQYQAKVLREHYRNGKSYEGGESVLSSVASPAEDTSPPMPVVVTSGRKPLVEIDRFGNRKVHDFGDAEDTFLFNLRWEGAWKVSDYEALKGAT